jgi:hypothetical protein
VVPVAFSLSFVAGSGCAVLLAIAQQSSHAESINVDSSAEKPSASKVGAMALPSLLPNGRPQLFPLPEARTVWTCDVVVIGGSLGGVAAASQAMKAGATTCLIESAPWLGGQISAQGVSALDESNTLRQNQSFSKSWVAFKHRIEQQWVKVPDWKGFLAERQVADLNNCWVGTLCFSPQAGATAAEQLLKDAAVKAPGSHWGAAIAFKGAEFDPTGQEITAVYAVRRVPRSANYMPQGELWRELVSWYSWEPDRVFEKVPIRLQAPPGKRLMVIDATDTGELIGWAGIPHRLGSDSRTKTGERNAAEQDNPQCTQAFTYPFAIALHNDGNKSLKTLAQVKPGYARSEHQQEYSLHGFPMFLGRSFFNYRRIISADAGEASEGMPSLGDVTLVNWNRGNDWGWMNPSLLLTDEQLVKSGQLQNWLGGLSLNALKNAEQHALLFAEWLLKNQSTSEMPLTYLTGANSPMGTVSGLSMVPYIREGRRIVGRGAYGQTEFMMREADLGVDFSTKRRDFGATAIALVHYGIDIHGCRYRNWEPSQEATSAAAPEYEVQPTLIPLESLIPQGVNNLLIGGKSLAVSHIVNAVTRTHYSEWSIGAAAGTTAGWLTKQAPANLDPATIGPHRLMPQLQQYLVDQGLGS